jgi:DNA polymerase-3 subunit alpha
VCSSDLTKFEDLIAMNALYRPGPMSEIPKFIRRAHGEEPVVYDDPNMEQDLKDTYGVLVYQEQFMNVSKNLCGFTGGEADTLRKAVSKKKIDLMREMKQKFIDGAVKKSGADREKMEKFWDHLEDFASYCFNKSHAACYSLIAYWTAWLKVHYPAEFMAALMTSDFKNTDRLTIEISECNRMGIRVLNPDINQSFIDFAVVPESGDIRFGFSAIKGVGGTAIESILGARNSRKFDSVEDFAKRTDSRVVNKRVWESLIRSGAFDSFAKIEPAENDDDPQVSGDRSDLLFALEDIIAFAGKVQKEAASGQESLFGMLGSDKLTEGTETHLVIPPAPSKLSQSDILASERELMGLYLSAHPLDRFATYFRENFTPISSLKPSHDGALADVGGLLSRFRPFTTKSGSKMAFCSIEDKTKEMEFVIFPKLFETLPEGLEAGAVIHVRGRVQGKDRDGNTLADPTSVAEELEILTDEIADNYHATGIPHPEIDLKTVQKKRFFAKKSADSAASDRTIASGKTVDGKLKSNENSRKKSANISRKVEDSLENYAPVEEEISRKLFIHVKDPTDGKKLEKLREILANNRGENEVILVLGETKKDAIRAPFRVKISESLMSEVADIYDEKAVFVK